MGGVFEGVGDCVFVPVCSTPPPQVRKYVYRMIKKNHVMKNPFDGLHNVPARNRFCVASPAYLKRTIIIMNYYAIYEEKSTPFLTPTRSSHLDKTPAIAY